MANFRAGDRHHGVNVRPGRIIGGAPAGAARAIHSVDGSRKSVGLAPQKFQRHRNKASLAGRDWLTMIASTAGAGNENLADRLFPRPV